MLPPDTSAKKFCAAAEQLQGRSARLWPTHTKANGVDTSTLQPGGGEVGGVRPAGQQPWIVRETTEAGSGWKGRVVWSCVFR